MSIPDPNFPRRGGEPFHRPDPATARFLETLGFSNPNTPGDGLAAEPEFPLPAEEPPAGVHLLCPCCLEELSISMDQLGVEGPCPSCRTQIVARQDGDGNVQAQIVAQFCPPPSLVDWPKPKPTPAPQPTLPFPEMPNPTPGPRFQVPERSLVRAEYLVDPDEVQSATQVLPSRQRMRRRMRAMAGISALLVGLAAAGIAIFQQDWVFGPKSAPGSEENSVSPSAAAQKSSPAPPAPATTLEPASEAKPPSAPPAEEPPKITKFPKKPVPVTAIPKSAPNLPKRSERAEETVRGFLGATDISAKEPWILDPEASRPALRNFYFLEPLVSRGNPQIQHVETLKTQEGRWVSLFDVIQPASLPHRVCVVHLDDGSAKVDFQLYRQMRENALHRFLAGPDRASTGRFRVTIRQAHRGGVSRLPVASHFKEPPLLFELRLPFHPGAPGLVGVPMDSPILEELQSALTGSGGDLAAVVELEWQPSEVTPQEWVVTIGRLVRTGLWD